MSRSFPIFFCIFISLPCVAADFFDGFYRSLNDAFSKESCEHPNATSVSTGRPICAQSAAAANRKQLHEISEKVFYDQLVGLEQQRLSCVRDEWSSFSVKSANGKANSEFLLAKMNAVLPTLQEIKNQIGSLTSQNQILGGRIPAEIKYNTTKVPPPAFAEMMKEYNERNDLITQLMGLFEQKINEIPNADSPVVRKFLEGHLSTFSKKSDPVTAEELESLTQKVQKTFTETMDDLKKDAASSEGLSIANQARLSSDPELIAQLTAQNPDAENGLPYLQCRAKSRMQTKERVELTATVVSFVLPLGALSIARAARAAFVLRNARMGSAMTKFAKGLGWAAMVSGGVDSAKAIHEKCFTSGKAEVKGQCRQTPQSLIEQHSQASCVWEATLAAAPGIAKIGGGLLLKQLHDENAGLSKFIEKMGGRGNLRAQDLNTAGKLDKGDRIIAAEGIIDRKLNPAQQDALLRAHAVGSERGFGNYTPEDIEEKRRILAEAGFNSRETETLLWKGVAGNSPSDMRTIVSRRMSEFTGKPATDAQVQAVMLVDQSSAMAREEKIKRLVAAGYSQTQAEEIIARKHHVAGSRSSTLGSASASVQSSSRSPTSVPSTVSPTARPTVSPQPSPTKPVPPATPPAPAELTLSSAAESYFGKDDALVRAGQKAGLNPTESKSFIDQWMKRAGYRPERGNTYSDSDRAGQVIASFNEDVDQIYKIQSRMKDLKEGSPDFIKAQKALKAYQYRCQLLPVLYESAGYSNTNQIAHFKTQMSRVCPK